MQLNFYDKVPSEIYSCDVRDIHDVLGGPSIMHLKGTNKEALFLGCLLHGNETTSFLAIQEILNEYKEKKLPRDLIVFFGNTLGASHDLRHLPDQPDFNRIWEPGDTLEHKLSSDVLKYLKEQKLFATIDIHNNSGKNPFYGCVNHTRKQWIELASLFSEQIVYFTEPSEVLSNAASVFCPSVTIEAGLPGAPEATKVVREYVDKILHLESFNPEFSTLDCDIYHTIGRIKIDKDCTVDFFNNPESGNDISFIDNIDEKNFELVMKNTHLGYAKSLEGIKAETNDGKDITSDIFKLIDGKLTLNRMFIPAMFTKDVYIMKEDCLGYIMEKMIPINC